MSPARRAAAQSSRGASEDPAWILSVADWRRRVSTLYAEARAEADPRAAWERWRAARDAMFRRHPASPLAEEARAAHAGLPFGEYDPAWRFATELAPVRSASVRRVEGGEDGEIRYRAFAKTRGLTDVLGAELTLFWVEGYGGGVFLPFRDRSNGKESFGGGRYLLDGIKGADLGLDAEGRVILDFNFAYNPSCAYNSRWVCPLSPPENRATAAVPVGELFRAPAAGGSSGAQGSGAQGSGAQGSGAQSRETR